METERKLPFDCIIMDKEPVEVANPFSGEKVMLEPDAVAVYDTIMGAELLEDFATSSKGKDWFRKHFPDEYMILLD